MQRLAPYFCLVTLLFTHATHGFVIHASQSAGVRADTRLKQQFGLEEHGEERDQMMAPSIPERREFLSVAAAFVVSWTASSPAAMAAATKDISGADFSGQDLSNKDFTKVIAQKTNFHNCNLQGSVFDNADLRGADFSGANLQGASFVDATLDGTTFANAQAQEAKFSKTILDVANFENVDLTDSLWPSKLRIMICDMDEIRGQNSVTGKDSKESLLCTDYNYKS